MFRRSYCIKKGSPKEFETSFFSTPVEPTSNNNNNYNNNTSSYFEFLYQKYKVSGINVVTKIIDIFIIIYHIHSNSRPCPYKGPPIIFGSYKP